MLNRYGYALLLLAFGALVFLLGVLLPQDLRQRLTFASGEPPTAAVPAPAAAAGAKTPTAAAAPPPALETLLLPVPAPANARYTLRLGLFTDPAQARSLADQVEQLHAPGLKTRVLAVQDRNGQPWWLTLAGDAARPADLEGLERWLRQRLSLAHVAVALAPPPAP